MSGPASWPNASAFASMPKALGLWSIGYLQSWGAGVDLVDLLSKFQNSCINGDWTSGGAQANGIDSNGTLFFNAFVTAPVPSFCMFDVVRGNTPTSPWSFTGVPWPSRAFTMSNQPVQASFPNAEGFASMPLGWGLMCAKFSGTAASALPEFQAAISTGAWAGIDVTPNYFTYANLDGTMPDAVVWKMIQGFGSDVFVLFTLPRLSFTLPPAY